MRRYCFVISAAKRHFYWAVLDETDRQRTAGKLQTLIAEREQAPK